MSRIFGDFNDANVLFLGGLPRGVLWLALFVAVVVLVLSWADLKELGRGRRITVLVLRGLVLILALLVLLEPALELRHVTRIKNHVAVLMDTSHSMTLPDDADSTRWESAQAFLAGAESLVTEPNEDHIFEVFRFDDTLTPSSVEDIQSLAAPEGRGTEILEALQAISERYPRRDLGGVLIVSDGSDSGVLSGRVRAGEPLDANTQRFIESLEVPIHTLALGQPTEVRDLAIERVLVDDFAFVRNRVTIEVVVQVIGFSPQQLPVTLRREGEVLQIRELAIDPTQADYRVTFEFIPEQIGKEIYSVSVPVLSRELLPENNQAHFVLKIIRDKIRVLQVCGRPSWDERFLREQLKRNPNVDLISFFILRTNESLQLVPNTELSLIPFPTRELFEEQLGSFDLVIMQNFTFRGYSMYQYLPRIEEYVRQGGAFVMIGGELSFASGGYTGTPISRILPVFLPAEGPDDLLIDPTPFRPTLSAAGQNHPITQLEFAPTENLRRWEALPELHGSNLVLAAKPGATVLLEHPSATAGGEPLAVLSIMQVDEGRSMALTSDSTWRWSFAGVGQGDTSRGYTTFWNSAIRWLIRDPELKLMQVEAPQQPVLPNEPFTVTVRVFQADYNPATDVTGTWELRYQPLDGLAEPESRIVIDTAAFTTDERGRVDLELSVAEPGAYTLWAEAELDATGSVSDEDIFLSLNESRELRDILPRPELLQALTDAATADSEHGTDLDADELAFADAQTVQVNRRRIIDMWNTPYSLGAIALLLAFEWVLRRRWGRL